MSDEEIVTRVLAGDTVLFEIIMRRHNQRLYRAARAILGDDAQAEDVVQDAYVRAYEHLPQFAGRASFAAWLIRIAVNEGLARLRSRKRFHEQDTASEDEGARMDRFASPMPNPEQQAAAAEIHRLLEQSIEALPDSNRAVFVLRDVEGMSTTETAEALGITEENVKIRLHRARVTLRKSLYLHARMERKQAFSFHAVRCDRVVKNVFQRIREMKLHFLGVTD
jgi:RNA polymerase sigma-70 factor (ECF subfamily)